MDFAKLVTIVIFITLTACNARIGVEEEPPDTQPDINPAGDQHDEPDDFDSDGNCIPTAETCNGVDDDCDDSIDEGADLCPPIDHLSHVCRAGVCQPGGCVRGFGDCNGYLIDGCERSLLDDPRFCGTCDNACDVYGTTMTCRDGECAILGCEDGFADCNRDASDGCEIDLDIHPRHCGACGTTCSNDRRCVDGRCEPLPGAVGVFSRGGYRDESYSCVAPPSGELWCWGNGGQGGVLERTPIRLEDLGGVTDIETHVGGAFDDLPRPRLGCAITDGVVTCWGDDSPLHGLTDIEDIAITDALQCAVTSTGTLTCAGEASAPSVESAVAAVDLNTDSVRRSANFGSIRHPARHGCVLHGDGTVVCWTWAENGGVSGVRRVPGIDAALAVSVGGESGCALLSNGRVRCFDFSPDPEEVIDATGARTVAAVDSVVALDGGDRHFCALSDDEIVCWGEPATRLGEYYIDRGADARPTRPVAPTPPDGMWIDISCGKTRCCALHSSGAAACWGESGLLDVGTAMSVRSDEVLPRQLVCLSPNVARPSDGEQLCDFMNEDCDDRQDEGCRRCGAIVPYVSKCQLSAPVNGCDHGFECHNGPLVIVPLGTDCHPIVPDIELCDGIDNDCDPSTPDGIDDPEVGTPCDGHDGDECNEGVLECDVTELLGSRRVRLTCTDDTDTQPEICGNGVDDDCDGDVDEGC